jgi:ribosomal subunit interface protein
MIVNYTGGNGEFSNAEKTRLESRLKRLGKMVDRKGENEAHVILSEEKRTKKAEVTVNCLQNSFAAAGTGKAFLPAMTAALDKLEKQIERTIAKKRDGKRSVGKVAERVAAEVLRPEPVAAGPRVFPAKVSKKPMLVEEAVLVALRKKVNYVAFRDAESDGISIVIERPDGHFDVVRA